MIPLAPCSSCNHLTPDDLRLCCWCGFDQVLKLHHLEQPGRPPYRDYIINQKPEPLEPTVDWEELLRRRRAELGIGVV